MKVTAQGFANAGLLDKRRLRKIRLTAVDFFIWKCKAIVCFSLFIQDDNRSVSTGSADSFMIDFFTCPLSY